MDGTHSDDTRQSVDPIGEDVVRDLEEEPSRPPTPTERQESNLSNAGTLSVPDRTSTQQVLLEHTQQMRQLLARMTLSVIARE